MHFLEFFVFAAVISGLSQADDELTSNRTISARQGNPCSCGLRNNHGSKIVGGVITKPHEFPWRVAMYLRSSTWGRQRYSYRCSASLIDKDWVMTAAHCAYQIRADQVVVNIGDHNLQSTSEAKHIRKKISKMMVHPRFNPGKIDNDIALMRLESSVEFSKSISPICLPFKHESKTFDKSKATTSGWGANKEGSSASTSSLQSVELNVISNADCSKLYPNSITRNMICTLSPGKDACQGDSGSSLDWQDPISKTYCAIGVVSFGEGCARPNKPGVFARVNQYLKWIEETTHARFCKA